MCPHFYVSKYGVHEHEECWTVRDPPQPSRLLQLTALPLVLKIKWTELVCPLQIPVETLPFKPFKIQIGFMKHLYHMKVSINMINRRPGACRGGAQEHPISGGQCSYEIVVSRYCGYTATSDESHPGIQHITACLIMLMCREAQGMKAKQGTQTDIMKYIIFYYKIKVSELKLKLINWILLRTTKNIYLDDSHTSRKLKHGCGALWD